jgi:hypothetical protein
MRSLDFSQPRRPLRHQRLAFDKLAQGKLFCRAGVV